MPTRDPAFDDAYQRRSLSEQLRVLERELSRVNRPIDAYEAPIRLPTCLGRPLGVATVEFPSLASLSVGADARTLDPAAPERRGLSLVRSAAIACATVLVIGTTAIVPPLIWRYVAPDANESQRTIPLPQPVNTVPRTDGFAHAARQLGYVSVAQLSAMPDPAMGAESTAGAARARATILTVPEADLARLSLPAFISDNGNASAASTIVVGGLPADARVSHGVRTSPDTWTVGIRDLANAVVSLPRETPERLDVSVRMVAADNHELAGNAVHIRVLRSTARAGPVDASANPPANLAAAAHTAPTLTSRFEPAAGHGEAVFDIPTAPADRAAVPPKPANSQAHPGASAGWTFLPAPDKRTPSWAPFGNQH